ncbi:hypothetical protein [Microbulbifer sp. HZ11]|uniref:hypothetical protein n=1 Tax=Microbulbifer sp. HZ11 TaxID=1453501 RepID=UPI000690B5CE|nr:hypothetical protein [Microbulbifer sp. HZ11]
MTRHFYRGLVVWCLLTTVLSGLAFWHAQHSFRAHLSQSLQEQLPERLQLALQNRLSHGGAQPWVTERLEQDLASIVTAGRLPVLGPCRAHVIQLLDDHGSAVNTGTVTASAEVIVPWRFGDSEIFERARLAVDCETNMPLLVGSQGLLALLLLGGMALLPRPLNSSARAQVQSLMASGTGYRAARRLQRQLAQLNSVQRQLFSYFSQASPLAPAEILHRLSQSDIVVLSAPQLPWFHRALSVDTLPAQKAPWLEAMDTALAVANAPDQLTFDCRRLRVSIHGIHIALSKTPFFYYLWYARLRTQGEGWVLNPPVNRPDRENAQSLIELMEFHGGHAKSINDLRENGLRAKTLDQNRNKIRDELVSALGEDLASAYLFTSERDFKSGRYRYRLGLDAASITFITH